MPVQIVLTDYEAPSPLGSKGSLLDYLADYYFLFGADQAQTVLNRAPDKPLQGELVGAPAISANFARFGPADYIRTTGGMGGALTFLAIIRSVNGERMNFGNYDLGQQKGLLAYQQGPGEFQIGVNGSFSSAGFTADDKFRMAAVTYDGAVGRLNIFANADVTYSATIAKVSTVTPAPFKVGGLGSGLGSVDAAAALAYPVALTQAELLGVYQTLAPVLAARGITLA